MLHPPHQGWLARREHAGVMRERAKERLRFAHFVASQASEEIMPLARDTLKGIYEKIADGLPRDMDFPQKVGQAVGQTDRQAG